MSELELGQATIVYDHPEEGQTEVTVDNEQIVYARDHWMVVTGVDDEGDDRMQQIPRDRVHYVERDAEQFEEQARTVRHRVESIARDLGQKLPVNVGEGGRSERSSGEPSARHGEPSSADEGTQIDIEVADEDE